MEFVKMKFHEKFIINLILIILVFFIIDFYTFYKVTSDVGIKPSLPFYLNNLFKNTQYNQNILHSLEERNNSPVRDNKKQPFVFAGCSFMYGVGIEEEETLPYKISNIMQVPVRNMGIPSKGLNTFLYIIENGIFDKLKNEISLLPPQMVLYNYADFHLRRMVMPNIFFEQEAIFYKIKNNNLILKKPPFIISRFAFLSVCAEHIYSFAERNSKLYRNYLKTLLKMHFFKIKSLLDEKYPNLKFVILVYSDSPIFEEISEELGKNGFYIIRMTKDFEFNVCERKYSLPDGHPSALIWQESAPLIAEKIQKILNNTNSY